MAVKEMAKGWKDRLWLLPALAVGGYLLFRNVGVWDRYSVDVLYWDQWDFWRLMFEEDRGLWAMFNFQHGPHKEGIGYFFLYVVAELTDWNVRAESLALIGVSAVTTGVFLWLKRRLFGRWDWSDLVVPALCLSFAHYEIYFIGTNPGLNVLPLLLIALIAVAIGMEESRWKYGALVVLGFCATYTGFGIFAGLLVPVYCVVGALREARARGTGSGWRVPAAGAVLSGLGFGSFFLDYRFLPAVPDFRFPHDPVWEYGVFVSKFWAHFFNLGKTGLGPLAIGVATALVLVLAVWRSWGRGGSVRSGLAGRRSDVVAFLCVFSFLFSANVAVGRISVGLDAGMVSRYLTFLVPLWVGGYFLLLEFGERTRQFGALALFVLLAYADKSFADSRMAGLSRLAEDKRSWVAAYLESGDILEANEASGFEVYPFDWAYERQEGMIDQMEREGLGFVRDRLAGSD